MTLKLVIDTNVLVAELLRVRGLRFLADPGVALFATPRIESETAHELRRRLRTIVVSGRLLQHEATSALDVAESVMQSTVSVVAEREFTERMVEARRRIPQDSDDAATVGLALALECGVWTHDRDFFGCGVPVWSTDVLRRHLDHSTPDDLLPN